MELRETECETFAMVDHESFDHGVSGSPDLTRLFAMSAPAPAAFTPIEDQVIVIARGDTLASLEAPGFVERAVRILFGLRAASRALADTRLEALRRAVVVARHRHHLPDAIARDLRERGFGDVQVRAIEARAVAA